MTYELNLIYQKKVFISALLEPLNVHNNNKAYDLYKPIRNFIYSLILSGSLENNVVEEIIFDSGSKIERIQKIDIINDVMNMEELWLKESVFKIEYFCKCVLAMSLTKAFQDKFSKVRDFIIDFNFVLPCMVLRYMISNGELLCQTDVDAFLVSFVYIFNYNKKTFQVN